jgi:hypothetical protein
LGTLGILTALGTLAVNRLVDVGTDHLDPLIVKVADIDAGPNFAFAATSAPESAPVGPDGASSPSFLEWAREQGGLPYGEHEYQVVVRGRKSDPVIISHISAQVVQRSERDVAWVNAWEGCGAGVPVREVDLKLVDGPPKLAIFVNGKRDDEAAFKVTHDDAEVFQLHVTASAGVTRWRLLIHYSSNARDGVQEVGAPDGRPFTLAGGGAPLVYSPDVVAPHSLVRDDEARGHLMSDGSVC